VYCVQQLSVILNLTMLRHVSAYLWPSSGSYDKTIMRIHKSTIPYISRKETVGSNVCEMQLFSYSAVCIRELVIVKLS